MRTQHAQSRGSLYVVSTPIGNLDDITVRALETLKSVALIAAEDTRRTSQLLRHFGIGTPTTSLHAHNERQKLSKVIDTLLGGQDVALVSDAGTPLVSDPGQRLIQAAIEQGVKIVPVPGASAVLSALAVSGYPADQFVFEGFAPSRESDRIKWFTRLAEEARPVVFFEAPHRIKRTLQLLADLLGDRPITLARELTKLHEEVIRTTAGLTRDMTIVEKGEFTLVLGPSTKARTGGLPADDDTVVRYFYQLTNKGGVSPRKAAAETGRVFGLTTNDVYARVERLKASSASP